MRKLSRKRLIDNILLTITVAVWLGAFSLIWSMTSTPLHFVSNLVASYFFVWGLIFFLSNHSRIENTHRFVLAGISFAVVITLLELLALVNAIDYRVALGTRIYEPRRNPNYLLDPELIHIHKPDQHLSGVARGGDITSLFKVPSPQLYTYDVKYDHNGFRNGTKLDQTDIAVVGDSFVEGALVPNDQIMTSVLAQLQNKSVYNLGQRGYGPQQELATLKRFALPLRSNIIVWMFYEGNDLKNAQAYDIVTADWAARSKSFNSFPERSFTQNALKVMAGFLGDAKPPAETQGGIINGPNGQSAPIYFLYPGVPLSPSDVERLEQTGSILADAYDLSAEHGFELIVVFVPTKYRVYNGIVEPTLNSQILNWVVNDLPTKFQMTVAEISDDIGYIDLTPIFKDAASDGTILYYSDDSHWTPDGHRLAAQAIDEYLLRPEEVVQD